MSNIAPGTDRDMVEIGQSFEFMSEDCQLISEKLDGQTRDDHLARELMMMMALRLKLDWNIKRLIELTGQARPGERIDPF